MGRVMRQESLWRNTLRYCALRRPIGADPATLGNVEDHPVRVLELALEVSVPFVAEVEEKLAAGALDAPLRVGEVVDLKAEVVRADETAWVAHVGRLATGAGIYIYENGLRVLEAVGAYEAAVAGANPAHRREVRDEGDRLISVHCWDANARAFSIVRQRVINALADAASRAGVEMVTGSTVAGASTDGELLLADGSRLRADLVVGADGSNSRVRDSLGLLVQRRLLPDGAIRLLTEKTDAER